MDLFLTEQQELIRTNAREFAHKHLDPIAVQIDEESRYPAEVISMLAELDWMGIPYPVEYGGGGADYITLAIIVEEISRSCAATGFTLASHTAVGTGPIFYFGSEEQRKKYLFSLCQGKKLAGFALTEPGAGTDAGAASTTAVLANGEYLINGTKTFISNGPNGEVFIVVAMTDKSRGTKGLSAFIVPSDAPGFRVGEKFRKMGIRASQTSELIFKDCRIPQDNLLGQEGQGFRIAMASLDHGRIGIAAQANGIIASALEESIRYSRERIQFNKPIAANQAIQWMIADMAVSLEASRFLTFSAAGRADQGVPFTKEASIAKLFASEEAFRHASKAIQIHGGYGYIKGCKAERLLRDAKITEIYEGTSEAQRMVISGLLLR